MKDPSLHTWAARGKWDVRGVDLKRPVSVTNQEHGLLYSDEE